MRTEDRLKPPIVKSTYHQRVRQSILPLSIAKTLPQAFREWFFTVRVEDHEEPIATCELCGKNGLRYHCQIQNRYNRNVLSVGSECIQKFDICVYEDGVVLDRDGASRRLNRLKREAEERTRHDSCVATIERAVKVEREDWAAKILRNAFSYYCEYKHLTPKYARVVFWGLEKHKGAYAPESLAIRLKTSRDTEDLRTMKASDVRMLWPALSPAQRRLATVLGHCGPGDTE